MRILDNAKSGIYDSARMRKATEEPNNSNHGDIIMSKRFVTLFLFVLVVAALAALSYTPTVEAKPPKSEEPAESTSEPFISPTYNGVALFPDEGENAECTADCGDGTGWVCSGSTVSCTDGEDGGCTAEGGGKKITAEC